MSGGGDNTGGGVYRPGYGISRFDNQSRGHRDRGGNRWGIPQWGRRKNESKGSRNDQKRWWDDDGSRWKKRDGNWQLRNREWVPVSGQNNRNVEQTNNRKDNSAEWKDEKKDRESDWYGDPYGDEYNTGWRKDDDRYASGCDEEGGREFAKVFQGKKGMNENQSREIEKLEKAVRDLEFANMDLTRKNKTQERTKHDLMNDLRNEGRKVKKLETVIEKFKNEMKDLIGKNKNLTETNKSLETDLKERKVGEPVYFSFFEAEDSLTRIDNVELLKKFMDKNEDNLKNVRDRIYKANEKIRDRIAEIRLDREKLIEILECTICNERPKDTSLTPCGHVFCNVCAHMVDVCPYCRSRIKGRQKVFL